MVKTPSVDDNGMRKGAWTKEEDEKLKAYVQRYGHWNWQLLPKFAGLARSGKSCRLRWMNYLKPGLKRGNFSPHEHDQIINLHAKLGNKWSAIALELPGRTDNEIKNYWYGHIAKRNPAGRRTTGNEEQVIKPTGLENLSLESYDVPTSQANSSANTQNEEMVSAEASKLETDHSSPYYSLSAEPITPDFWTQPFELDTDTPLEMDIYSQASHIASFLEEDLMFNNVYYNDFSFSDYAAN